ncbi:MAG: DUF3592 domain-containing protein [Candidatus Lokiarchaeota archaeon]|nr:DUF3592 domain-containing protein [Candidatus Lokiarchaeota archaeon]MBD3200026.1 DUF3592 domain-containing protein [Candidatus Lokiarchaeota archaeon]
MFLANLLIGLILLAMGIVILVFSIKKIQEKLRSQDWPPVDAEILDMKLEKRYDEDSGKYYRIKMRYQYSLGEATYSGEDEIDKYSSKKRELKKRYAPGTTIKAYYNPESPYESVLEPGINIAMIAVLLIIPAIFIITGFVFIGR